MGDRFIFYVDDFGTRTICKGQTNINSPAHEFIFSLGGIIVREEEVNQIARAVNQFTSKWRVGPLHGSKIRSGKGKFSFLKNDDEIKEKFLSELEDLILQSNFIAHACVICRPGYRDRYSTTFTGATRWEMSKTAFDIAVERAVKLALHNDRRLDVVYEECGKKEDRLIEKYYRSLKVNGIQFSQQNSKSYNPLQQQQFKECLNNISRGKKNNELLQLADLVIHPISHVAMGSENRAYKMLKNKEKLIDFKHSDDTISIKYSCFDNDYNKFNKYT